MVHKFAFVVVVHISLLVLVTSQRLEHYCHFSRSHTLCSTSGIGDTCKENVLSKGVANDAGKITALHNDYRARVAAGREQRGTPGPQPRASNMREVVWDEELALLAQRHSDQCVFQSDCVECRRVSRFDVGQNIYLESNTRNDTTANWEQTIKAWYDNVADVPDTMFENYKALKSTSAYAQLMWAETHRIGCGFTTFRDGEWFRKLYTCNYGPAGNVIASPMYKAGRPCSQCPSGTACSLTYPGLCGTWTPMWKNDAPTTTTFVLLPVMACFAFLRPY